MSPRPPLPRSDAYETATIGAWRLCDRVTRYLIENLPDAVWTAAVPGAPRRSVRMIAGHLHNARCAWTKMLDRPSSPTRTITTGRS